MSGTLHFTANGKEFVFFCESSWTRNGFKHVATLVDCKTWRTLGKATMHYLNRTWEEYTYQSVCLKIARSLYDEEHTRLVDEWKESHGYKRMTQKRKDELKAARLTSPEYELYRTLAFCIGGEYRNERPRLYGSNVGNREFEIMRNLTDTRFVSDDGTRLVYKLIGDNNEFCVYDARSRQFVG